MMPTYDLWDEDYENWDFQGDDFDPELEDEYDPEFEDDFDYSYDYSIDNEEDY